MAKMTTAEQQKLLESLLTADARAESATKNGHCDNHVAEDAALHLAANVPSSLFQLLSDSGGVKVSMATDEKSPS